MKNSIIEIQYYKPEQELSEFEETLNHVAGTILDLHWENYKEFLQEEELGKESSKTVLEFLETNKTSLSYSNREFLGFSSFYWMTDLKLLKNFILILDNNGFKQRQKNRPIIESYFDRKLLEDILDELINQEKVVFFNRKLVADMVKLFYLFHLMKKLTDTLNPEVNIRKGTNTVSHLFESDLANFIKDEYVELMKKAVDGKKEVENQLIKGVFDLLHVKSNITDNTYYRIMFPLVRFLTLGSYNKSPYYTEKEWLNSANAPQDTYRKYMEVSVKNFFRKKT